MSTLDWAALPPFISVADLLERTGGKPPATESDEIGSLEPGSARLVLADVRWRMPDTPLPGEYEAGHIPGAIFVDLEADLTGAGAPEKGRHPFPEDDEFAATLSRLGIAWEDTVVAYSDSDPMAAARLVVMLRLIGMNAAVLDGGLAAYIREAGLDALESGTCSLEETDVPWQPFVRLVSLDEVAHSIPTRGAVLIDARAAGRFAGEGESLDARPGHIPTAINVPYTEHLDEQGLLRSADQLRATFESAGLSRERLAFNYCGSGVSAAVNMLAMDAAGFTHVYLYPGSYSEWSRDPARPVETGARKTSDDDQ